MKLKSLYSFLLATALVACNEDFNEGIAGVQTADPETPAAAVSFSATAASATTIDLGALAEGATTVKVCSFTATPSTETTTVTHVLDLRDAENNSYKFDLTTNGEASVEELQAAIEEVYGKRPTERTFDAYVYEYLNTDGQSLIGKSEKLTIKLTPDGVIISDAYYLMLGDAATWEASAAVQLSHSDKDVYEDPVFSLLFTLEEDNAQWLLVSKENMEAGVVAEAEGNVGVASEGDASLAGDIARTAAKVGKLEAAGMYRLTVNMLDGTYEFKRIAPIYHLLGDITAWSADAKNAAFYPSSEKVHSYTTNFTKADGTEPYLKFILAADLEALAANDWSNVYGGEDGSKAESAEILGGNPGAFCSPSTGYYTLTIDMEKMVYTWTKLEDQNPTEYGQTNDDIISIIGDYNSWKDGAHNGEVYMTQVTPHNWYVENFKTEVDGTLKFRSGFDWQPNWGASINISDVNYGVGVNDGPNITVPAGTYNVYFNDITGEFLFVTVE